MALWVCSKRFVKAFEKPMKTQKTMNPEFIFAQTGSFRSPNGLRLFLPIKMPAVEKDLRLFPMISKVYLSNTKHYGTAYYFKDFRILSHHLYLRKQKN